MDPTRLLPLALAAAALLAGCAATRGWDRTPAGSPVDPEGFNRRVEGFEGYDQPPRLIRGRAPVYPISAVISQRTAEVLLAYTIGEYGVPRDIQVLESPDEVFARHAILAVREWRYAPAIRDGRPVAVEVQHPIAFSQNVARFGSKSARESPRD
jgi:TonB family protein